MWRGSPDAQEGAKTSATQNGVADLHAPSLSVTNQLLLVLQGSKSMHKKPSKPQQSKTLYIRASDSLVPFLCKQYLSNQQWARLLNKSLIHSPASQCGSLWKCCPINATRLVAKVYSRMATTMCRYVRNQWTYFDRQHNDSIMWSPIFVPTSESSSLISNLTASLTFSKSSGWYISLWFV